METVRTFKQSSINLAMQDRTLRFRLQGPGAYHITRSTFVKSLDYLGIYDIEGLWKAEDVLEYQVTFRSYASVKGLKELSLFDVYKDVKAIVTNANESVQNIRFYWVPLYIENECLTDYLESKDLKIVSQEYLKDEEGVKNGVRQFKVLGTKDAVHKLPHLLDFELYNCQCLLRVQGREPMCLRCRKLGHLRNTCPEIQQAQQRRNFFQQRATTQGGQGGRGWEKQQNPPPPASQASIDSDSDHEEQDTQVRNSNVIDNTHSSNTENEGKDDSNDVTNKSNTTEDNEVINNTNIENRDAENEDKDNTYDVQNKNNTTDDERDDELDSNMNITNTIDNVNSERELNTSSQEDDLDTTITTDNTNNLESGSESEPLLNEDGSLVATQPECFEEKHSRAGRRSKSQRNKKK